MLEHESKVSSSTPGHGDNMPMMLSLLNFFLSYHAAIMLGIA